MKSKFEKKTALVTGTAGFIGFHIARKLLSKGWKIIGIDSMSEYYDVLLKRRRESILLQSPNYKSVHAKLEDKDVILDLLSNEKPDLVIHLAAQAGVRYSIENPRIYLESNVSGTFELLEAARAYPPTHLLIASTSSAYGASDKMPYKEIDNSDHQISLYAATKKSIENISHSYSHLFGLPTTIFRFFTVYGPWGRPDMALFKFTKSILQNEKIDVYNYGKMKRDFTYIDDLVESVFRLIDCIPETKNEKNKEFAKFDSISSVAPYRIVNIGNSKPIELMQFIRTIEKFVGKKAKLNMMPLQAGDITATYADNKLLEKLTGYTPKTTVDIGIKKFVDWYRNYYQL